MERILKHCPKGKYNDKRIGGLKFKVEFNLTWWCVDGAFNKYSKNLHIGPVHIWVETAYEK